MCMPVQAYRDLNLHHHGCVRACGCARARICIYLAGEGESERGSERERDGCEHSVGFFYVSVQFYCINFD